MGSRRFVQEVVNKRLQEKEQLWEAIPAVPDLQAAWQILLHCAGPRCHHMLLHMIDQRPPVVAPTVVHKLTEEEDPGACFQELRNATTQLDWEGFLGRPQRHALRTGTRPGAIFDSEPGEWPHGWQHYASSSSSKHTFKKNVALHQSCAADQAHLRSHSGPRPSEALCVYPSKREFRIEAGFFRTVILERLRLPLHTANAVPSWTEKADTEPRAHHLGDSKHGLWHQRGHWPGCAEMLVQRKTP